ncbi:uncharacterized protein PV09_08381 [Verruconis gallopava]|uniref:DUF4211 domain-containing protein n=1 Tax=Verruconis gallopava TaxID=253628 RepID=A0A0D2ALQ9_9PEZI|nr:uncharacterized protein PV09_08381 [Verruconis gallopava]KIW00029.1 hypothetical protein PV09_08381 [Verruconis gallopava]
MARTKRQARLAFSPVHTSSPSNSHAIQEHGQRKYAKVSYEGSQHDKKRRRLDLSDDDVIQELGFPTPDKSSQLPPPSNPPNASLLSDIHLESESVSSSARLSGPWGKRRAKQGRLNFSNHIGTKLEESEKENNDGSRSDSSSGSDRISRVYSNTNKRRTSGHKSGIFSSQKQRSQPSDNDQSEDEALSSAHSTSDQSSSLKRLRKGTRGSQTESSTRRPHKEPFDPKESNAKSSATSTRRQISQINVDFAESESSGDDAPELYSSPTNKRKSKKELFKNDGFVVFSDSDETFDAMSKAETKPRKGRLLQRRRESTKSEQSDVEEVEKPRRRRLKRKPRTFTLQEQEDLEEDLEFLQSSPPSANASSVARKANPRLVALEALKRKRAGLDPTGPTTSRPDDAKSQGYFVSDASDDESANGQDEHDENESITSATASRHAFAPEDEDDDFIVEDDEDEPLGAPDDDIELPIYLTGITRMKPKQLFRYAVEWMVQKKLNPAYSQDREIYAITFKKLNDEVKGLAGSTFTSSAWTRDFTISLQARPGIELTEMGGLGMGLELDKCQACNRSGHPATFQIKFTGRPYNPETLEPLEQDGYSDYESNDNESDGSSISREEFDAKDRLVPSASRTYNVGRFCKDNALTAHALEHWKYQLNSWIVDWLENEGYLTDKKIVKRDRWDEPRRRKYAKKVVETMEATGQIKALWRQFRDEVDGARGMKSGWTGAQDNDY